MCRLCRDKRAFRPNGTNTMKKVKKTIPWIYQMKVPEFLFPELIPLILLLWGRPSVRLSVPSTCCGKSWWCLWSAFCRWDSRRWTSSWVWGHRCSTDTCVHRRRWPCPRCSRNRWSTRQNKVFPMETSGTWVGWRGNLGLLLWRR